MGAEWLPSIKDFPHSMEAERAVLGAMLFDPDWIPEIAEQLRAADFYRSTHQALYQHLVDAEANGTPETLISISDRMNLEGSAEKFGGIAYVARLGDASTAPVDLSVERHTTIIRNHSHRRRLIEAMLQAQSKLMMCDLAGDALQGTIESLVREAGLRDSTQGWHLLSQVLINEQGPAWLERKEQAEAGGRLGVTYGVTGLDDRLPPLEAGEVAIVAARPGMGKTSFVLGWAAHIARTAGPVAFFSLEMSRGKLADRFVSAESGVYGSKLKTGELNARDLSKLYDALERFEAEGLPIYLCDEWRMHAGAIRSKLKSLDHALTAQGGPGVAAVVIDYLQLIDAEQRRNQNREQVIAGISRQIKYLAGELGVPIILLSQLNRKVEDRSDKRPVMSDLRESGSLEQDVDVILMLYRRAAYDSDADPREAEVIITKAREGQTGTVEMVWDGARTRFESKY